MRNRLVQTAVVGFIAGAISVLLFHQVAVLVAYQLELIPFPPYSLEPTAPLGVPAFVSSAFWGGLWGIVLALVMARFKGADRLWVAALFGAVLPPLVYVLIVAPLKGGDSGAVLTAGQIALALIINGAWGLGTGLFYRLGRRSLG